MLPDAINGPQGRYSQNTKNRLIIMKTAFFSTKLYDQHSFTAANQAHGHDVTFFEPHLTFETAALAAGFPAVCVFINDESGDVQRTPSKLIPNYS